MIFSKACPHCSGAIVDYGSPLLDGPLCLNCGWKQSRTIQPETDAEIRAESQTVSSDTSRVTVRRAAV